jgi:hypothetical protein
MGQDHPKTRKTKSGITWSDNRIVRPQHLRFAEEYIKNGGKVKRAVLAAYPEKVHTTDSEIYHCGKRMMDKPHVLARMKQVYEELDRQALPSVQKLAGLRDEGKSEKIQLEASKSLLDQWSLAEKARLKKEETHLTQNNILIANLSDDEIRKRIAALTGSPSSEQRGTEIVVSPSPEEEVSPVSNVSDGGDTGVQESGTCAQGDRGNVSVNTERQEASVVPPATGTS